MKQDIKYTGLSANPSDHEAPDGSLTTALNVIPEEGQLKPLFQPSQLAKLPYTAPSSGDPGVTCSVIFIHKTASYTHYIVSRNAQYGTTGHTYTGYGLYWFDEPCISGATELPVEILDYNEQAQVQTNRLQKIADFPPSGLYTQGTGPALCSIEAIGNTLVVLADDGMHYLLWKDDGYINLGMQPPMLNIQFGTSAIKSANYDVLNETMEGRSPHAAWKQNNGDTTDSNADHYFDTTASPSLNVKEEKQTEFTDFVWALVNKANATIREDGHFYAPFIVRYCYRLYDGSMIMHSAPVFIPLSMKSTFRVEVMNAVILNTSGNAGLIVNGCNCICGNDSGGTLSYSSDNLAKLTLRYRPANVALTYKYKADEVAALSDWSDIVTSVDIFVSLPILRENDSKKIETATKNTFPFHYANNTPYLESWASLSGYSTETDGSYYSVVCDIPMLTDAEYLEKIKSTGTFYKLHSYTISELNDPGRFVEVSVGTGVLNSLASQEAMTDDYNSHNLICPFKDAKNKNHTSLYAYNYRLNIAAPRQKLFKGFGAEYMTPALDNSGTPPTTVIYVYRIAVQVPTSEGNKDIVYSYNGYLQIQYLFLATNPLFYPDTRAKKMTFYYKLNPSASSYYCAEFYMEPCPFLNGAYTKGIIFDSLSPAWPSAVATDDLPTATDVFEPLENKIYTSEVNNPFYFPVTGINTIGSGTIVGLSSAAKPLSQGQFGQFPLYAFATDGVWALSVTATGSFSAVQPVTRDVCISSESITQLDASVLFASDRGIMLLEGNLARCITDSIATEHPFDVIADLPQADTLHHMLHPDNDTCLPTKPFNDFLHGCQMVYDYVHQRVIVFNPSTGTGSQPTYTYAYVYSLKSTLWGMMYSNLNAAINSYPDAMAMSLIPNPQAAYPDHTLVTFLTLDTDLDGNTRDNCLFITRPLKLGDGNALKSIHTLIQRGYFQRGDVNTVLYGSRDLVNWHIIASSVNHEIRNLRGTPYKYFRVASVATLTPDKSIYGITVDVEPRHTSVLH